MSMDLYKKIINDKGSDKAGTVNKPLSWYLIDPEKKVTEFLSTNVITANLLFGGRWDGGIPVGRITMMAAPSKFLKTFIALSIIKDAQKKNKSVVVIDAEHRFPFPTAKALGIDISKQKLPVLQENGIEEVKTIILKIVEGIPKEDCKDIVFVIDSWGVLVSSKTLDDGLLGKDVADMTIGRKKNDLARVLLNTRATYLCLNHVYDSLGGFTDPVLIPGGRSLYYNSSSVVQCTSRSKDKDKDKNINGYIITAKSHKGDFCKEGTVLDFKVSLETGLNTFYGLIDDAIEAGVVENSKPGWFVRKHIENDIPVKEEDIYVKDFWLSIFNETKFGEFLNKKYQYSNNFDIVKDTDKLETIGDKEEIANPELLVEDQDNKKGKKCKK